MEKALGFILDRMNRGKIVVYGAFGGRMDQTLASLHVAASVVKMPSC